MKKKSLIRRNLYCIALLIIHLSIISCGFNDPNASANKTVPFAIDTSAYAKDANGDVLIDESKQEQYHREWIENTKDINKGEYFGEPDLWGGGAFGIYFWFNNKEKEDSKYLWYRPWRNLWGDEIGFILASEQGKPAFIDGQTAIMYLIATTSSQMENTIYIFRVGDNKIGRTENAWGFEDGGIKIDNWDGKTIPIEEFSKVVVVNEKRQ